MVGLNFTVGSGKLTVTGPPNANIAPPGYYMLFLINNNGVPSVAPFVLVQSPPPSPTQVTPGSGSANGGTPVTITGTGFARERRNLWGDVGDQRECGQQHVADGDDAGAQCGRGGCSGEEHGQPDGDVEWGLYLHDVESGADGDLDSAPVGDNGGGHAGDDHGDGLSGGSDGHSGGDVGDQRECGQQHVADGDDAGAQCGGGGCSGEEHGQPDGDVEWGLYLHDEHGWGRDRVCTDEVGTDDVSTDAEHVGGDIYGGADGGQSERGGGGVGGHDVISQHGDGQSWKHCTARRVGRRRGAGCGRRSTMRRTSWREATR